MLAQPGLIGAGGTGRHVAFAHQHHLTIVGHRLANGIGQAAEQRRIDPARPAWHHRDDARQPRLHRRGLGGDCGKPLGHGGEDGRDELRIGGDHRVVARPVEYHNHAVAARLQRCGTRAAAEKGEFADRFASLDLRHRLVAGRRLDQHAQAAGFEEIERIGWIALAHQDVPGGQFEPVRAVAQRVDRRLIDAREQSRLHPVAQAAIRMLVIRLQRHPSSSPGRQPPRDCRPTLAQPHEKQKYRYWQRYLRRGEQRFAGSTLDALLAGPPPNRLMARSAPHSPTEAANRRTARGEPP